VDYSIVARSDQDPIFFTAYAHRVGHVRSSPDLGPDQVLAWAEVLRKEHGERKVLILPSTEYLNRTLLAHRESLEQAGCIVPLVSSKLYEQLSDKESFARACEAHDIPIPAEYPAPPSAAPFVAKPKRYAAATGQQLVPQLILSGEDLERFSAEEDEEDYFYQEFVTGRSLYLLAHVDSHKPDLVFSQENLIQQPRGGSVVLARPAEFHLDPLASKYLDMLHSLGFHGMIMIEVRLDESTGRAPMIEANPRIWGPQQLSQDNGVDFFGALLSNYGFPTFPSSHQEKPSNPLYFWSGGLQVEPDPPAYHNYSPDEFARDFPQLQANDLFLREDTLDLYLHQSGATKKHE